MIYKHIFFDLDGTLTDPFEGITKSVMFSLEKFGIKINDRNELKCFIGPPLWESFMKYFGFSKEEAELAVKYYRDYFSVTGLFENKVYPGIYDFLGNLKREGLRLSIATSKPAVFSKKILEKFDLTKYFDFLSGSELNGERVNKHDVIEYAISSLNISDRNTILMIGDRHHDIDGAKKSGIASVGVLWGYGDRKEFEDSKADHIVENLHELKTIILS